MIGASLAAVDLGAASGRVIVGHITGRTIEFEEVHRFPNGPVERPDGLHWDVETLFAATLEGLRLARRSAGELAGIAIDSWAIDYGLLDRAGALIGEPFHYRDARGPAAVAAVHARIPPARLYDRTGIQFLPFNTIYQLVAERTDPAFARAADLLLIPDLFAFRLTGVIGAEATNASTTGLFDVERRDWATDLIAELDLPRRLFPPIAHPGDHIGPLRDDLATAAGLTAGIAVTHVGSHDTASAFVGAPATDPRSAIIACGTWALVGVEIAAPVLTEASRAANFTNELGVDGRVRYLRNVMGLWLLQESIRTWRAAGLAVDLPSLVEAARRQPPNGPVFDPDDARFLAPGDIPTRIAAKLGEMDQPVPATPVAIVRCILDSLAAAFARAIFDATRLSGHEVEVIHLVGGGSQNQVLCQLVADACGRPVVAGPVEATAVGNLLIQARTHGFISGDLEGLRALTRAASELRTYAPARAGSSAAR